jgi:hypothetical protein
LLVLSFLWVGFSILLLLALDLVDAARHLKGPLAKWNDHSELGLDRLVRHREQEAEASCYGFPMVVEVAADRLVCNREQEAEAGCYSFPMVVEVAADRLARHQEPEAEAGCYGFPMVVEVAAEAAHHFCHDDRSLAAMA